MIPEYKRYLGSKTYKSIAKAFVEHVESGIGQNFTIYSLKKWLMKESGINMSNFDNNYYRDGHNWHNSPFLTALLSSVLKHIKDLGYKKVVRAGGFYIKRKVSV